jgi:hypothetical protein
MRSLIKSGMTSQDTLSSITAQGSHITLFGAKDNAAHGPILLFIVQDNQDLLFLKIDFIHCINIKTGIHQADIIGGIDHKVGIRRT